MAQHIVTDPSGQRHIINAPDDATPEQVVAYAQKTIPQTTTQASSTNLPEEAPGVTALRAPGAAERFLRGIPGLGGALDEGTAIFESLLNSASGGHVGEPYDVALQRRREAQRQSDAEHPLRNAVEGVVGGVALTPLSGVSRIFSKANPYTINTAADMALTGAALSGLSGFSEGEGGFKNRVKNALEYGKTGAVVGGIAGAAGQRLANRLQGTDPQSIARQGEPIGVTIPKFMEGGRAAQNVGSKLAAIPFVGDDINDAVALVREQTKNAAEGIAQRAAGGAVTPQSAGEAVRGSMRQYVDETIRDIQTRVYAPINRAMGAVPVPLSNTARAAQNLSQQQQAAASRFNDPALEMVTEALGRGGLTFEGLTALRSQVGILLSNTIDPKNKPMQGGLKAIYGALTRDMEKGVLTLAGSQVQQQWRNANRLTTELANRRSAIASVIGKDGRAPGEGIVDTIVRYASSKSTADAADLARLQRATGASAWRQLAGVAIERLGRNQANKFSPDIFLKNYGQLSEAGRNRLFAASGNNIIPELDRLAAVSERLQQFNKLGNPSGSGGVVAILSAIASAGAGDGGTVAASLLGGRGLGYLMSRPAVVRAASNYGQILLRNGNGGIGGGDRLASASAALARAVAAETGEDEEDILRRMESAGAQ